MNKKKILIVEDEYITALDLKIQLMLLGISDLEIVPSGELAIERASRKTFDLILMDIKLNGQIDGIEAAEKIRKLYSVPFVFISGNSDLLESNRLQKMNAEAILSKPITEVNLKNIVTDIFKK